MKNQILFQANNIGNDRDYTFPKFRYVTNQDIQPDEYFHYETEEFNVGDAMVNNNGRIHNSETSKFLSVQIHKICFRNFLGLEAWLLSYNKRCSWILKPKEYMDWTKGSS